MLKVSDLNKLIIPNFPEISVDNILKKFKEDDEVKMHFPDFTDKQKPERKYLLGVLFTIQYDYMFKVIKHCHQARIIGDEIENSEWLKSSRIF